MKKVKSSKLKVKSLGRGFTIIELLVVVAIMIMLGSLILIQLQSARMRGRDAEREEEIKTLQNALTIYVVNNKNYPVSSGPLSGTDVASQELLNKESLPQIPFDPLNTGNYRYVYASSDGATYTITYYLETDSIPGKSAGAQTVGP